MRHSRLDHLTRRIVAASALALPAAFVPAAAGAQAFGLTEIGTCAVGRTGAGVGAPCEDASRVFWNPGAAVRLPQEVSLLVGAAAIQLGGGFHQDTTGRFYEADSPLEAVPHLFANYRVQRRFAVGFGVYVPYGLTSQWKEDFPGRFQALKASLASIYVQPNFAFDVIPGRLAIGGGPVIGISEVELIQALDLATVPLPGGAGTFGQLGIAPGTEFGRAELHGSDVEWGYNVGVHWQVARSLSIGARYLSELAFKYNGAVAEFEQTNTGLVFGGAIPGAIPAGTPVDALLAPQFETGRLTERNVYTQISHPAQAQVGIGFTGIPRTTVNLDYAWVDWSVFDELPVDFSPAGGPPADVSGLDRVLYEDYEDSWSVKGSVDYAFGNGWTGRAGAGYVKTPAPDVTVTPLLPDQDRYNFGAGLSIPLGARYVVDAGYWRVETPGRRGRVLERTSRAQTAAQLNGGWYELNANVLSVSLKATW